MATCRAKVLGHLPVVLSLRPNFVMWGTHRLHLSTRGIIPRTRCCDVCTHSQQLPKQHALSKSQEPLLFVSPFYLSSWISTCTATRNDSLPFRSRNVWVRPRLPTQESSESLPRFDPSRSFHGIVPQMMTNKHRGISECGIPGDRITGARRLQEPVLSLGCHSRNISLFGSPGGSAWTRAIAEAEKIVGYPTSFIGLRCLLSDELSNVAMQVRKLVGTKHPLVKTARSFVYDGKYNIQTRGLIVLLIAKAAGPSPKDESKQSMVRGIYPSQRTLAEIAEMIHTAFLVHKGVVNIRDLLPSDGPRSIMEFGNKISVLSGDFLLASACKGLAELRNTHVVDLISQSISDLTQAAFMPFAEDTGENSSSQRLVPDVGVADWAKYVYLSSGSLIAKSCRAALELAGHGEEMQTMAFEFGKNIALAQQLHQELQLFTASNGSTSQFSLTSAPVLLHLEGSNDRGRVRNQTKLDFNKLHREIQCGPAIQKSRELCETYAESARLAIAAFPQSDAKDALMNMVKAVS